MFKYFMNSFNGKQLNEKLNHSWPEYDILQSSQTENQIIWDGCLQNKEFLYNIRIFLVSRNMLWVQASWQFIGFHRSNYRHWHTGVIFSNIIKTVRSWTVSETTLEVITYKAPVNTCRIMKSTSFMSDGLTRNYSTDTVM